MSTTPLSSPSLVNSDKAPFFAIGKTDWCGRRQGKWTVYVMGEKTCIVTYQDNTRHGLYQKFYNFGSDLGSYVHGMRQGEWAEYDQHQRRFRGFYTNDQKHGPWTIMTQAGNITRHYRHGQSISTLDHYRESGSEWLARNVKPSAEKLKSLAAATRQTILDLPAQAEKWGHTAYGVCKKSLSPLLKK